MQMTINTNQIVSNSEANQNFSHVEKMADIEQDVMTEMTDDEKIDFVTTRILKLYRPALEELAK